jgi:hypothetical protein
MSFWLFIAGYGKNHIIVAYMVYIHAFTCSGDKYFYILLPDKAVFSGLRVIGPVTIKYYTFVQFRRSSRNRTNSM